MASNESTPLLEHNTSDSRPQSNETQGYLKILNGWMDLASGNPSRLREEMLKDQTKKDWNTILDVFGKHRWERCITDVLAQMIYLAPDVAAEFLDWMLEKTAGVEPPQYANLGGWFLNDPMHCYYQKEVPESKGSMYQANPSTTNPNFHEITKYRFKLPNVLDLDIIQALCITPSVNIFAKKSVQAMLYCAWPKLMVEMITVKLSLSTVELITLMLWGMTTADGSFLDRLKWSFPKTDPAHWLHEHAGLSNSSEFDSGQVLAFGSSCNAPFKWSILAAMSFRQIINWLWKTLRFACRGCLRNGQMEEMEKPPQVGCRYLREVWSVTSYLDSICNQEVLQLLIRSIFLLLTHESKPVMSSSQQAMLSLTFFMSAFSIGDYCRVVACKVSISRMAMRKALADSEVLHFGVFVVFFFVVFILSWEIFDRESTVRGAMILAFRGLVIGDGDGLDFLGQDKEETQPYKILCGTFFTVVFFSYLMNLLIAIFGNTYDAARRRAWLHFHQVRAQVLRNLILSCDKTDLLNLPSRGPLVLGGIILIMAGVVVQFYLECTCISFVMMALGAVLFEACPFVRGTRLFPHNDVPSKDEENYLYVWCRADYDEDLFLGTEAVEQRLGALEKQGAKLDQTLEALSELLEKHVKAK